MRWVVVAATVTAASCGDPGCVYFPGPPVEAGTYRAGAMSTFPTDVASAGLPYADAQDFTVEISPDRSEAILRYARNGVEIEETWSIRIVP